MADEICWTSFIGHPAHSLGAKPERCYTCAAKAREDATHALRALVSDAVDRHADIKARCDGLVADALGGIS